MVKDTSLGNGQNGRAVESPTLTEPKNREINLVKCEKILKLQYEQLMSGDSDKKTNFITLLCLDEIKNYTTGFKTGHWTIITVNFVES